MLLRRYFVDVIQVHKQGLATGREVNGPNPDSGSNQIQPQDKQRVCFGRDNSHFTNRRYGMSDYAL